LFLTFLNERSTFFLTYSNILTSKSLLRLFTTFSLYQKRDKEHPKSNRLATLNNIMADVANLNSTHLYLHDWALSAIHEHSKILGVIDPHLVPYGRELLVLSGSNVNGGPLNQKGSDVLALNMDTLQIRVLQVKLDNDDKKWFLGSGATAVQITTNTGAPAIFCSGGNGGGFTALGPHLLMPSGGNLVVERCDNNNANAFLRKENSDEAQRSMAMYATYNNGTMLAKWGGCGPRGMEGDGIPGQDESCTAGRLPSTCHQ
jgi:hypothetical protein